MILEIFRAAIHSVGTATTMTIAGVYLHRRGMITTETKTGMARYTQQIAIPSLFFTKIVDCPQTFVDKYGDMNFDNFGLDYGNPDYVKYAESYGAKGYRIEKTSELLPLMKKCQQESGVHLIDIPVDYSENDHILNNEIKELSKKI